MQDQIVLPEWFEKLDKFNEAHCAVGNHEILKAFETAFTPTVPRSAAPCPATHREKGKNCISWDGKIEVSDVSGGQSCPATVIFHIPWLGLNVSRKDWRRLRTGLDGPRHAGGRGGRRGRGEQSGAFTGWEGERSWEAVFCGGKGGWAWIKSTLSKSPANTCLVIWGTKIFSICLVLQTKPKKKTKKETAWPSNFSIIPRVRSPGSSWSMLSDSGPFRYSPSLQLRVFLETISSSVASPLSP